MKKVIDYSEASPNDALSLWIGINIRPVIESLSRKKPTPNRSASFPV
jgi:hypothetical protein